MTGPSEGYRPAAGRSVPGGVDPRQPSTAPHRTHPSTPPPVGPVPREVAKALEMARVRAGEADAANRRPQPSRYYLDGLSRACRDMLGVGVSGYEFPGGTERCSMRLHLEDGRSVIATRRAEQVRLLLEEGVLRHLGARGAPVPRILGFNGLLLLQEDLGDHRLSRALHGASAEAVEGLLDQALTTIAAIHRAADAAGLDGSVLALGAHREWLIAFIDRPSVLGSFLQLRCPVPKLQELFDLLTLVVPRFVKWDARPGNAIIRTDGRMAWIDWEDCGARNRLDDMAWLLGDEFVPDLPIEVEERLLAAHVPHFADDMPLADAVEYLSAYGTLHMCVRLGMILNERGGGPWWDQELCLATDQVGVTLEHARRLCRRAARWSARSAIVRALSPWFDEVEKRLGQL